MVTTIPLTDNLLDSCQITLPVSLDYKNPNYHFILARVKYSALDSNDFCMINTFITRINPLVPFKITATETSPF